MKKKKQQQSLYKNGTILTMDENQTIHSAMLIEKGHIRAIGEEEELQKFCTKTTKTIDLKGKTVMPGFLDAHGHFIMQALSKKLFLDVSCYPIGKITSIKMLLEELDHFNKKTKGNTPIIAFGFDDTLISEYRMPLAKDLDKISKTRSIIVLHTSIHMMSANTAAMQKAKVVKELPQPKGGTIYYEKGKPIGIFEEMPAMLPILKKSLHLSMLFGIFRTLKREGDFYLSKGITTVCEGAGAFTLLYQGTYKFYPMKNRAIICPAFQKEKLPKKIKREASFRLIDGPIKLILDGSIQAYTAYLSTPYEKPHPTRPKPTDYRGFPSLSLPELKTKLSAILGANRSFAVHCNGDAAIDLLLQACEDLQLINDPAKRNLIIHCQTVREDQLEKMKTFGLLPSFFPAHIYVWGDRHYETFLGPERGSRINPLHSAKRLKIPFSLHNDAPVTTPDPLKLVWNAVTRTTSKGMILGAEQKIDVYEALKGITSYAAYQYHLEDELGTLTAGKRADFVLLSKNPLTCKKETLKDIKVLASYMDGNQVYKQRKGKG